MAETSQESLGRPSSKIKTRQKPKTSLAQDDVSRHKGRPLDLDFLSENANMKGSLMN